MKHTTPDNGVSFIDRDRRNYYCISGIRRWSHPHLSIYDMNELLHIRRYDWYHYALKQGRNVLIEIGIINCPQQYPVSNCRERNEYLRVTP